MSLAPTPADYAAAAANVLPDSPSMAHDAAAERVARDRLSAAARERLEHSFTAYREGNESIALASLFLIAVDVRNEVPEAVTIQTEWSDQGPFLTGCVDLLDVNGDDLEADFYADDMGNLDESNEGTWAPLTAEQATDDKGRAPRWIHFNVQKLLDDLAPRYAPPQPVSLVGKTIGAVRERSMAGRDTFKDWHTWTETVLTFTDGTTLTVSEDNTEVYDPFEYDGTDEDGNPIPVNPAA